MDVLVVLGTTSAWAMSTFLWLAKGEHHVYFESGAWVIAFVLLGRWLEGRARFQTSGSLRQLESLQPESARVLDSGVEKTFALEDVRRGMLLRVRPGERIPLDGIVRSGESHVDESLVTGESLPLAKLLGDKVKGGSLNAEGVLGVEVLSEIFDSTVSKIVRLVESAQSSKAPVQVLVDRISSVFVPLVLVASALTFAGWALWGPRLDLALLHAVAVLVIACPCAMGLATPAALVVGLGKAAQQGILLKNAVSLEKAGQLKCLVLDKTGTLTEGRPTVNRFFFQQPIFQTLAVNMARWNNHPLSRSLSEWGKQKPTLELQEVKDLPGRGMSAVHGGLTYSLLGENGLADLGLSAPEAEPTTRSFLVELQQGNSTLRGWIEFADPLKPQAREALRALQELGIELHLASGDNTRVVSQVAAQLGVSRFQGNLSPEEKQQLIRSLQQQGNTVGMVGDGINDAPALAAADLSIAFGAGSQTASDAAGITLLRDDPFLICSAIQISRDTQLKIRQNLFWAFVFNVIGIPLAAAGLLSPALAGGAMALSSFFVVTNALLLRRTHSSSRIATPPKF